MSKQLTRNLYVIILLLVAFVLPIRAARVPKITLLGACLPETPRAVTIADLEKLPLIEYTVLDPFSKKPTRYKGVLVRDIAA